MQQTHQGMPPQIDYSGARTIPANFCNLRHTNEEFLIDLGMSGADPISTKSRVDTSVVMSPFTAKRLWLSLGTLLANFERNFGEIEIDSRSIAQQPTPIAEPPEPIAQAPQAPAPQMPPAFEGARRFARPAPPGAMPVLQGMAKAATQPFSSQAPPEQEPNNSSCIPAEFDRDS